MKVVNGTYYETSDIQNIVTAAVEYASTLGHSLASPAKAIVGYGTYTHVWTPDVDTMKMMLPHRGYFEKPSDLEQIVQGLEDENLVPEEVVTRFVQQTMRAIAYMVRPRLRFHQDKPEATMMSELFARMGGKVKIRIRKSCPRQERLNAQAAHQSVKIAYREHRRNHHASSKERHRLCAEWHHVKEKKDEAKLLAEKTKLAEVERKIEALKGAGEV